MATSSKNLKKDELKELCATFFDHIEDLKVRLKKAKHPPDTSDEAYKLPAELKDLKDAILVDENGINGMGDKLTGSLTQTYWAGLGDKRAIPWKVINKFAEDDSRDNNATSSEEDYVKGAVNATSIKEDNVEGAAKANPTSNEKSSSKAKSAKLAKLVNMAQFTDLWCLSPFVLLTQEAKAKQRQVCPVNLRGEVCTVNNCGSKHTKVCLMADQGKGKIPKAKCALWPMRVLFAGKTPGNFTGRRSGPNPPTGSKGSNSSKARPAKPDKYLVKHKAEYRAEELKARIRAAKMMSQGIIYSQVVGVVPPQVP
jgi:hypothetical protein